MVVVHCYLERRTSKFEISCEELLVGPCQAPGVLIRGNTVIYIYLRYFRGLPTTKIRGRDT